MAESHYSADSAPLPPPRLLFTVLSAVTRSHRASVADGAATTAGKAFPLTPSLTG